MNHDDTELVAEWLTRLERSFASRDFSTLASLLRLAREETQDAPEVLEFAGIIAFGQGANREAAHLLETAMFEMRLSFSGLFVLACCWLQAQRRDQAMETFEFLLEMKHRLPCSLLPPLTHKCADLGRYLWAIQICREAERRHPEDHNAVFARANYMAREGYPAESVRSVIQKALNLKPDCEWYRANLAVVLSRQSLWHLAYQEARQLSPEMLKRIPCHCMSQVLERIFERAGDDVRCQWVRENRV